MTTKTTEQEYNNIYNCDSNTILTDEQIIKAYPGVLKYSGSSAPLHRELTKKEQKQFLNDCYGDMFEHQVKRTKLTKARKKK